VTYGGPLQASHPRAENNQGNLWWTLAGKPSKGRKIIKAIYDEPLWGSHPKAENNQGDLWWILTGKPSKGRK